MLNLFNCAGKTDQNTTQKSHQYYADIFCCFGSLCGNYIFYKRCNATKCTSLGVANKLQRSVLAIWDGQSLLTTPDGHAILLLLVCVSFTTTGQPRNSVPIRRVQPRQAAIQFCVKSIHNAAVLSNNIKMYWTQDLIHAGHKTVLWVWLFILRISHFLDHYFLDAVQREMDW